MIRLEDIKFVIFGASGFLGKNLVEELYERNLNFRAFGSSDIDLTVTSQNHPILNEAGFGGEFCIVINLAANCGGIGYNQKYPVSLFTDNMKIIMNMFELCRSYRVDKLINVGTVCSYPLVPNTIPFKEEEIWDGYPESTNAPYGIAKKSAFVLSECYQKQYGLRSNNLMLANMYGKYDHFNSKKGHVIPDLIHKFNLAVNSKHKEVQCWGDGTASRDFLYGKDAVSVILRIIEQDYEDHKPINIGTGRETTIKTLVDAIADNLSYKDKIKWVADKPNGQPRRVLDISKLTSIIGEYSFTPIEKGLSKTIEWYLENKDVENF